MKKSIFILLVLIGFTSYGQITLNNYCNDTTFNLTSINTSLTPGQNTNQFTYSYYQTQSDAENNINPITATTNYQSTATQQIIFARVVNINTLAVDIIPFLLVVNTALNVGMAATLDWPSSTFFAWPEGGLEPYTYQWSYNGLEIAGANTSEMYVLNYPSGTFAVTITDINGCSGSNSMNSAIPQTINANDDNFTFTNGDGGITPPGVGTVLSNDTLNSFPVNSNSVSISLISTTNSNIGITPQGFVYANSQTPSGNHTLVYQICELGSPNNCDIATVNIIVDYCRTATPVIDSLVQPGCESQFGSITLSGLPVVGTWTITLSSQATTTTYNGSGTSFGIQNLNSGNYTLNVIAEDILLVNCFASFNLNFSINYTQSNLSVLMTGTYVDYNNDGYTNVGDMVNYSFTVSNNSCNDITNINLENQILTIVGDPISVLTPNTTDTTTFTATYVITQNDINSGNVTNVVAVFGTSIGNQVSNDYVLTLELNLSDGIKLNAFLDYNSNGVQDNLEPNFNFGEFYYDINGGPVYNASSSNGALLIYESNAANFYNIGYTINTQFTNYYTVSPASYANILVVNGSGMTTYNFPITLIPHNDLAVQLYNYSAPPRPGFIYNNYITYTNYGNQIITSGTLTFVKNPLLSITNISEAGAVINTNGFTYDFVNLLPNQTRYINLSMQVPTIPTVVLGQQLTNTCSISMPINDTNINNNTSSLTQTIVGSYDPNDKAERHGGEVVFTNFVATDYLTYTIRFENTGTANAINVKVDDLLDSQLDETTVRTLTASHPFVLKRVNNALTWNFDGINLPPSVEGDDVTGHGYIVFQAKPKPGFALGDIIPNTANIYFDFNPAVVTNTWTTEFVPFLGVNVFDSSTFEYYPNPTSAIVTFAMKNNTSIDTIEIVDVLGKTLISKTVHYANATIDLSSLAKGVYLAKVKANGQEKTIKIAKQ